MEKISQSEELEYRLSKDLVQASKTLSVMEIRFLVDSYYTMQENRIRNAHQVRTMLKQKQPEPCAVLEWLFSKSETLEGQIKRALKNWCEADSNKNGQWCLSTVGIGPVITAGLLSHIDITKAPTVGHIWSFAGLVPGVKWEKGQKRPWNAALKRLCWLIGQSFMKNAGRENCHYGKIYRERKALEQARNHALQFKEQAAHILATKKIRRETEAYKYYSVGQLPPAQIEQRSERYATKLFLSHLHHVMYLNHYNTQPPKPYPIAILGHADMIQPFNLTRN